MSSIALTRREIEILDLAAQGMSNNQIAEQLAISRRTVEAHLRTLFRKTGVTGRAQLSAVAAAIDRSTDVLELGAAATAPPAEPGRRAGEQDRLRRYAAAIDRLIARQFSLFEERVEITLTVGESGGQDLVTERHRTTPKPYVIYRVLRPILSRDALPLPDPGQLGLHCTVFGADIQTDLQVVRDEREKPQVLLFFQPGLQSETEWLLSYRSPNLWEPLRTTGRDTLTWATATLDGRYQPTITELTVKVVFPAGWDEPDFVELGSTGAVETDRLPSGQVVKTWRQSGPPARAFDWALSREPAPEDGGAGNEP